MYKKIIIFPVLILYLTSACGGTFSSIKDGLTGAKRTSSDEFLVKKKDQLVLPPDFETLPKPEGEITTVIEEVSSFEKTLRADSSKEEFSTTGSSEKSILEKIRKK